MLQLMRLALTVPSDAYRRRIWWCVPPAIMIALLEATSFGLLYLLLQAVEDRDTIETGLLQHVKSAARIEDESSFLWVMAVVVVVLMLLKGAASIALLWWETRVLAEAEADSSTQLFAGYMRAPYTFHLQTNSAVLIRNVVRANATVYQSVLLALVVGITECSVLLLVAAVLVISNPLIALLAAFLMGIAAVFFLKSVNRHSRRIGRANEDMEKRVQQQVLESIHGVKILQVLNREDDVIEAFHSIRTEWARYRRDIVFINQLPRYYLELVLLFGIGGVGLGAALLDGGRQVVATVGILVAAALRMIPSLNKLLSSMNKAQVGRAAVIEISGRMAWVRNEQRRPEPDAIAAGSEPLGFEDRIEVRELTFSYEGADRPALSDLDLTIRHGESVGIVGASGAGKTTLVNVLLGLLWPDRPSVFVDGRMIERSDLPAWRDMMGYVPQDIFLTDASLRRNVALGVPEEEIDDDRVRDVLRLAMLEDFVSTLPEGIDTFTGEHGVRFSGGERQRVGIARALYPQPKLLLLDEATSALDGVTEAQVAATIASLRGQITMIIIAHRLSTVNDCDRIVLLRNGRVEQEGSFDQLAQTNVEFAAMLRRATPGASVGTDRSGG